MANTFKRKLSRNITTVSTVGSYTAPAATQVVVIGLRITNTTAGAVKASAMLNDATNDHYLIGGATVATMGADIPVGGSLIVINGDADKVVMETGDSIKVVATGNVDVVMSVLEVA